LSSGERQRIALARALVFHPPLLVMDEPMAHLDSSVRDALLADIRALRHSDESPSVLLVTHDRSEAQALADRVALLCEGRLTASGPPDLLAESGNPSP
jgi:ABC-type sulfate/molybdate transport systems ATPase subunit